MSFQARSRTRTTPSISKVLDRHGNPVVAERLFHSGEHQTYTVRTAEGYEVTGTANHPLLCLVDVGGVPTLLWKLIEEIRPTTTRWCRRACGFWIAKNE